jgi:hypothetical protein
MAENLTRLSEVGLCAESNFRIRNDRCFVDAADSNILPCGCGASSVLSLGGDGNLLYGNDLKVLPCWGGAGSILSSGGSKCFDSKADIGVLSFP